MDPMEEIRETFFIECEELLETLEAGLIAMSDGTSDGETVNAVFRAVHSIKGGAGAFALDALVEFAHKFENVLDLVRSDKLDADQAVMDVLLRSGDVLSDLVSSAQAGEDGLTADARTLLTELIGLSTGGVATTPAAPEPTEAAPQDDDEEAAFEPLPIGASDGDDDEPTYVAEPIAMDFLEPDAPGKRTFSLEIRPHAELFAHGSELTLLLRALAELGDIETRAILDGIPTIDELSVEQHFFTIVAQLETGQDQPAIEDIFDFVDTECDLKISVAQPDTPSTDTPEAANSPTPDTPPASSSEEVKQEPAPAEPKKAEKPTAESDRGAKSSSAQQSSASRATVRVDVNRVDRLVNLVGELVVTQAGLSESVEKATDDSEVTAANAMEEFKQLTRELQECVMSLRTQPLKPLFQRMQRISREASAAAEKSVRLQVNGDSTEVDRTVIERLSDPLTHMIRNAIDHGIEPSDKRIEQGKSEFGTVSLNAAHRSGRVVIEVSDDGGGINRAKVRSKAVEKGLIAEDANLSNGEIDQLLFAPGFSTASAVTNLSGRGVGMDVVKKSIQALGGRISISSDPGRGTSFSISLPLTLAVLDGMIVQVDQHTVVIPLTAIVETHKPATDQIVAIGGKEAVLSIRGNLVPVVDVGEHFGYRSRVNHITDHVTLLIESEDGGRAALIVDDIVDQRQVVIKGLDDNYGDVIGIAAATILGDGSIALILDTDELVEGTKTAALSLGQVA
ncbi:MAG: chemotaxis protein CheA [Pseudomonadota bacterium]